MTAIFSTADLFDLPGNPVPPGAEVARVATPDGVALRAASWRPTAGVARGTVLLLQGRAEFIEKYFEVVGDLRVRGYRVVAFDWRGQGGSDRALAELSRGHVRHFSDFRLDYEAVAAHYLGGSWDDVTVLAHSMGGCVALTAACEGWLGAGRLVASSPMVALSIVRQPRIARLIAGLLAGFGLAEHFVPGGQAASISTLPFEGNRLSTDAARYARNAEVARAVGWGAIGSPTVGWLVAAYEAMDRLGRCELASVDIPVLVVAGDDDPVCSTPATERLAAALPRGRLLVVPGARHEVMMEADAMRAMFWEAFDGFAGEGGRGHVEA